MQSSLDKKADAALDLCSIGDTLLHASELLLQTHSDIKNNTNKSKSLSNIKSLAKTIEAISKLVLESTKRLSPMPNVEYVHKRRKVAALSDV